MSSKLDQSLDDVIKANPGRRSGRGGSGSGSRGSGSRRSSSGSAPPSTASNPLSRTEESNGDASNGSGPIRRQRQGGRSNGPYQRPSRGQFDDNTEWKHDLHQQEQQAQARLNADKIYVSNLDTDVNDGDVEEIFGKVGKIVKVVINFNQHGKSLGTAEVTFARKGDAEKAVAEYDGAEVDGRPMAVKLVGTLVQPRVVTKRNPPPAPQQYQQPYQQRQPRRDQGFQQRPRQSSNRGAQRQGGNRQGGRGGRQESGSGRREKTPAPTLESLDAELDSYHTKPAAAASAGQPSAPSAAGQPASA